MNMRKIFERKTFGYWNSFRYVSGHRNFDELVDEVFYIYMEKLMFRDWKVISS
jgi:hypothetical protein